MAKSGQQKWLFGRVRIDRPVERAREAVSAASDNREQRRFADGLDREAAKITDPNKRAAAERKAAKYRRKHVN